MPRTLITGATGFIGARVAHLLADRGDELRITVRPSSRRERLAGLELDEVECDILDRRAIRRAMRGVDRVFHLAGLTSMRASTADHFEVNVTGTRIVLEEALRAGVERAVHVSAAAAIGPAVRGSTADETQVFTAGRYDIPWVNSKHEAEGEALRLAAQGLPLVIANPCHVFGRGDLKRSSTELVRRFMARQIPAYVDGAVNIVDVEDVARGIVLVEERGRPAERYILGNRNFTLDRLFADLGRLSEVEPPAMKLPLPVALGFVRSLESVPGTPPITAVEVRAMSLWWSYRNTKAKRELGWKPSPHEDTVEATVQWYRELEGRRLAPPGTRQAYPYRVAGFAIDRVRGVIRGIAP